MRWRVKRLNGFKSKEQLSFLMRALLYPRDFMQEVGTVRKRTQKTIGKGPEYEKFVQVIHQALLTSANLLGIVYSQNVLES